MKTINPFVLLFFCVFHHVYGDSRCGTSWGDANGKCGTSCPDGTDSQCPSGEHCYSDLVNCNDINNSPAPQGNARCGTSWADANGKCGNSCPDGTDSSCPSGEQCFTDLVNCEDIQQPGDQECDASRECPLRACCSQWGFCGWTADFCNDKCLGNCELQASAPECDASQSMTVSWGYYASWAATRACDQVAPGDLDVSLYTHLAFSFAFVSEDFRLVPSSDNDIPLYREFNELKSRKSSLKTVIAVGGWAFNDPPTQHRFSNMASSQSNRQVFVDSVIEFLRTYGFDGLDIDWEYPAADDRGGSPDDFQNYADLLDELRQAFDSTPERFSLTIAVPLSFWYLRHFDLSRMHDAVDHMNIMSYDIHGVWDANIPSLGPYVKSHTNITEIEEAFNMFFKNGVPPHKLVLGGAAYARTYTLQDPNCFEFNCPFVGPGNAGQCTQAAGTLSYSEILSFLDNNPDAQKVFDAASASNYIHYGDQWISYDDPGAFGYKIDLASTSCFKGIMIWSVDQMTTDIAVVVKSLMTKALEQAQALPVEASDEQRLNDMIYICTHNSFTNYQDARWASVSQTMSISNQLKNGVRSLMLDTYYKKPGTFDVFKVIPESGVYLLHAVDERGWIAGSTYALPSQRLYSALDDVINFLKDNRDEIVTIFLEDYTETDRLSDELSLVSDLGNYLYDPDNFEQWKVPDRGQWPAIKDLIDWDKRLLIFSSRNHDNPSTKIGVPYDWKYTKQNYWSLGGLGEDYACRSRWNDGDYIDGDFPKLFIMNHYRDVPSLFNPLIDNTKDNIIKRAREFCEPEVGQLPNFIAVDFFDSPGTAVFEAVAELSKDM